jgi:hypothetical protein
MVKQRFLTHFTPWLIAVTKAGALIVGYQLFDQIRTRLQYAPLDVGDVVMAATTALFALALFCALWAWGEWCWFKLRAFRRFSRELKQALTDHQHARTVATSPIRRGAV